MTTDPRSVAHARAFTRTALADWGLEALEDRATLCVSELVTNVLRHAGGSDAVLEVRRVRSRLTVLVSDDDDTPPLADLAPDGGAPGGRGILLVRHVTDDWGIEPRAQGKVVWASFDTD